MLFHLDIRQFSLHEADDWAGDLRGREDRLPLILSSREKKVLLFQIKTLQAHRARLMRAVAGRDGQRDDRMSLCGLDILEG